MIEPNPPHHANQFKGTRLKEIRNKSGLNQTQLAGKICSNKTTISKLEQNRIRPTTIIEESLTDFFKVEKDYFRRNNG